eukprot:1171752-Amphidinium_carterae.2
MRPVVPDTCPLTSSDLAACCPKVLRRFRGVTDQATCAQFCSTDQSRAATGSALGAVRLPGEPIALHSSEFVSTCHVSWCES